MNDTKETPVFIPYKSNEAFANAFYQVPVELFKNPLYKKELNSDSKLLYALLINRLNLSLTNNWVDEDGNVYLIFSRKEAQEILCLSDKTVTKAFKCLIDTKLISEKRQGKAKNNLIYVGKINNAKEVKVNRKIYDSRNVKSTTHESENLRFNNYNNKYKNNKYNNSFQFQKFYDPNNQNIDLTKYYCNVDNKYFDTQNPDQYSEENLEKLGIII
jgi:hypothetical protein